MIDKERADQLVKFFQIGCCVQGLHDIGREEGDSMKYFNDMIGKINRFLLENSMSEFTKEEQCLLDEYLLNKYNKGLE